MTPDQRHRIEDACQHYATASQLAQQALASDRWIQAERFREKMWDRFMDALDALEEEENNNE